MKRQFALLAVFAAFSITSSWGAILFTTNPATFNDPVNWCQSGCRGTALAPQQWTSTAGATGLVGLDNTGQPFYDAQQEEFLCFV